MIKKGRVQNEIVPQPEVSASSILVKVEYSCISAGTELSGVQSSGQSLIKRALNQPDKARKVVQSALTNGISNTVSRIKDKLEDELPIGYSLSGVVADTGKDVTRFRLGDRVACAGAGIANHAEYVNVPDNLAVGIPESVSFQHASTAALGAIAMQAVRRAEVSLGDYVVVFGLGILGQITLQMLKSSGAHVIGIDIDDRRLRIAEECEAELTLNPLGADVVNEVVQFTDGQGADKVIFAAAASASEPLRQAFQMTRKKGRVVMLGVSGMQIDRNDIYSKEIDFMISTSYGPGRYDESYELKGNDYPYAYVRWTENRNMREYMNCLADGRVKIDRLIDDIYPIERVSEAFEELRKPYRPIILLLEYNQRANDEGGDTASEKRIPVAVYPQLNQREERIINTAVVGAGSFARMVHLPNLTSMKNRFRICAIMDKDPLTAKKAAARFNAHYASSDYGILLDDEYIDLIMITTRHNLHGEYVLRALQAQKSVFVEKPLCLNREELNRIRDFYPDSETTTNHPLLMAGFNRRFSKYAREAKRHTSKRINPLMMHYRMNAGYIPLNHWVHSEEGGGRIIGEACHIIDLFTFFTESRITDISTVTLTPKTESISPDDNRVITVSYEDGSVGVLEYFSVGSSKFSKEYMEIHFDQKSIVIDDYKSLKGYGVRLKEHHGKMQQKGHKEELEALYVSFFDDDGRLPVDLWDIFQTTEATFSIYDTDSVLDQI